MYGSSQMGCPVLDGMVTRNNGTERLCKYCGVLVQFEDKNFATMHLKGSTHQMLKKEGKVVNFVQLPVDHVPLNLDKNQRMRPRCLLQHQSSNIFQHSKASCIACLYTITSDRDGCRECKCALLHW